MIEFELKTVPPITTAQQKRMRIVNGKPMFFKKQAQEHAESVLAALLREHQPESPIKGPTAITIHLRWPYLSNEKKGVVAAGFPVAHVARPDVDNWAKGFIDLLVQLCFIENDQSIVSLCIGKDRGPDPHIKVAIAQSAPGAFRFPLTADELQGSKDRQPSLLEVAH